MLSYNCHLNDFLALDMVKNFHLNDFSALDMVNNFHLNDFSELDMVNNFKRSISVIPKISLFEP